jgi:hypothetical protein
MDKEKYNMKDENGNWCSKERVLEYIEYLVGFEIRCDYSFSSELLNRYNSELIGECVGMRRYIDKLKKTIKKLELC